MVRRFLLNTISCRSALLLCLGFCHLFAPQAVADESGLIDNSYAPGQNDYLTIQRGQQNDQAALQQLDRRAQMAPPPAIVPTPVPGNPDTHSELATIVGSNSSARGLDSYAPPPAQAPTQAARQMADGTLAAPDQMPQPVITVIRSPGILIKKEVINLTPDAPQQFPSVAALTPRQLAELAPAAGADDANTPLIPLPPVQTTDTQPLQKPAASPSGIAVQVPPQPMANVPPPAQPSAPMPPMPPTVPAVAPVAQTAPMQVPQPSQPVPPAMPTPQPTAASPKSTAEISTMIDTALGNPPPPLPPTVVVAAPPTPEAKPLVPATVPAQPASSTAQISVSDATKPAAVTQEPPRALPPITKAPSPMPPARSKKGPAPLTASGEPVADASKESMSILSKIPEHLGDTKSATTTGPVAIDHARDTQYLAKDGSAVTKHEATGINIEVNNQKLNSNYEVQTAYDALIAGHSAEATEIYKRVLVNDPDNKNALFGLATAYHRTGQIDMARPLYGKLLSLDPSNRDALNNFLVLLADEAPDAALTQLGNLEKRNPAFSPIPAQMAVIYEKLGDTDHATQKMFRAVNLEPGNVAYRYNLAIMLDKQHKYEEAAQLYRQVIESAERGEAIPGNIGKIQERLTFISSNGP